ncbi:hypothetical protein QBC34DRAFT_404608 [Podospora aff. communis PSN243]|uniref:Ecp2 effector protein domain-containing protein n=1 Tax=Podospora aff. communis PSN243 TaxID=3040156 RepID=A0AAV9GNT3_9PEZI|nr:hypothetical protein QBC34DRAFT_404608 [Podospora aff. communis PSN243]
MKLQDALVSFLIVQVSAQTNCGSPGFTSFHPTPDLPPTPSSLLQPIHHILLHAGNWVPISWNVTNMPTLFYYSSTCNVSARTTVEGTSVIIHRGNLWPWVKETVDKTRREDGNYIGARGTAVCEPGVEVGWLVGNGVVA